LNGLATSCIFWNRGSARMVLPPRTLITGFEKGMVLGEPNDETTHRSVLKQALDMLKLEAPQAVMLPDLS
jgi:hypothetical protein